MRVGHSISIHAALLLKLKPHFLSISFPYPAGIKYKAKKHINPKTSMTISTVQYTEYNMRNSITAFLLLINYPSMRSVGECNFPHGSSAGMKG